MRFVLPAVCCSLCLLGAAPAQAGGLMAASPAIDFRPRSPILDAACVDRLKGDGASAARAAHECRKPYSPGTAQPTALRQMAPTATPAAVAAQSSADTSATP
jgi:hypothetical protein